MSLWMPSKPWIVASTVLPSFSHRPSPFMVNPASVMSLALSSGSNLRGSY